MKFNNMNKLSYNENIKKIILLIFAKITKIKNNMTMEIIF